MLLWWEHRHYCTNPPPPPNIIKDNIRWKWNPIPLPLYAWLIKIVGKNRVNRQNFKLIPKIKYIYIYKYMILFLNNYVIMIIFLLAKLSNYEYSLKWPYMASTVSESREETQMVTDSMGCSGLTPPPKKSPPRATQPVGFCSNFDKISVQ